MYIIIIGNYINTLKISNNNSRDVIIIKIIKMFDHILHVCTHFQHLLKNEYYPGRFKTYNIISLHNSKENHLLNNCRPIATKNIIRNYRRKA